MQNSTDTTNGRIVDLGDGVLMLAAPSVIVATDSHTGEEVARFTNWDDADAFIDEALLTMRDYDIREVATTREP